MSAAPTAAPAKNAGAEGKAAPAKKPFDLLASARRAALVAVQVGRKTLAIEEDDWRALLTRETGLASTRAMSLAQLAIVRQALERMGYTPQAHGGGGRWRPIAKHPHQRKVYALWGELKRRGLWRVSDVASLQAFVARVTGGACQAVEWLTPAQSNKVIEALKEIEARGLAKSAATIAGGGDGKG